MSETTEEAQAEQNTEENGADASGTAGSNILVAYFTYGENADLGDNVDASSSASIQMLDGQVTGNTGVVASVIADLTGADTFSIRTVESYPDNYNDTIDQGQEEQQEDVRPELSGQIENLDSYDTIFLGYPNWWGDMPMAIYSFLDEYDLSGKTIVPFVTSGGSGFSRSVEEIEDAEPDAEVLEGLSLSDSEATDAQRDVEEWLGELGYLG
ncbi:MAG TPA: flavodoxin [Candidatus Anaerobutyricum faecale]|nr:flavodoxin [Eubacterium sp. An11]HJC31434.1 flavodoxin [Candidatus Anaerobutyricum faecale]